MPLRSKPTYLFFFLLPHPHQIAYEWDLGPSRRVGTTLSSVLRGRRVLDIPTPLASAAGELSLAGGSPSCAMCPLIRR